MERREHRLGTAGLSIALSAAVIVCARLFLIQSFDGKEQGRLFAMASGLLGSREAALEGQSVLLGRWLRFCYGITTALPWYTLMLFGAGAASLAVTGYVACSLARRRQMLLIQLILTGYFAVSLLGKLRTQTAACALTSASMLLLLYGSFCWRRRFPVLLAVLPAAGLGSLLHFPLFVICSVVMTAAVTADLCFGSAWRDQDCVGAGVSDAKGSGKNTGTRQAAYFLAPALLLILILCGVHMADLRAASKEGALQAYQEQARGAALLEEYGLPDYAENKKTYKSLGISKANYVFFRNTGEYDYSILTAEAMKTLSGLNRRPILSLASLRAFADSALPAMGKTGFFSGAVTVLLLCLIAARRKKRLAALLLGQLLLCVVLCYCFWCRMFAGTAGSAGICFLAAAVCMLGVCAEGCGDDESRQYRTLAGVCAVILCMYFIRGELRSENGFISARWDTNYHVLEVIRSDPEHFYFRKEGILSYENCADPWKGGIASVAWNTAFLKMEDLAPLDREWLAREYGVTDPWKDMIGNEKVYLIDDDIEDTLRFLRKNYSKKVEAQEVGLLDDRTVYRLR